MYITFSRAKAVDRCMKNTAQCWLSTSHNAIVVFLWLDIHPVCSDCNVFLTLKTISVGDLLGQFSKMQGSQPLCHGIICADFQIFLWVYLDNWARGDAIKSALRWMTGRIEVTLLILIWTDQFTANLTWKILGKKPADREPSVKVIVVNCLLKI